MELTEDELLRLHHAFPYPRFSAAEYRRRYQRIRGMMREQGVDCLLIIGGSAAYGRLWANIRYVTNMIGKADQATYVVFPQDGEPRIIIGGHAEADGMLARCVVSHIVEPKPNLLEALARTVREVDCANGRIGLVEYDPKTSIPKNHWDFLASSFPRAELKPVTGPFLRVRLVKSEEEIACLERSSELNDIGITALAGGVKPGMTEAEAFAVVHDAVLRGGGELGMIQLASAPMEGGGLNDQRPRPVGRRLARGDYINNELGVFFNGYEAQSGKPVVLGQPTAAIADMFRVALDAYQAVAESLAPGKTSADSIRAARCIREAGYTSYGPFVQGMYGYDPRYEPEVDFPDVRPAQEEVVYEEGMVFVVQPHLMTADGTRSLFLGDTFAITGAGPRCLNRMPPQLFQV